MGLSDEKRGKARGGQTFEFAHRGLCGILQSFILFARRDSTADVPFRFVFVQHLLHLLIQRAVECRETLG